MSGLVILMEICLYIKFCQILGTNAISITCMIDNDLCYNFHAKYFYLDVQISIFMINILPKRIILGRR